MCFRELSAALHPQGLTYPVAAATGVVTLGGALANDIHGKNHTAMGSLSRHVDWFDLMLADGSIVRVGRSTDPDLWRATVGGLGLTGIVLRLKLALQRLPAPAADVRYRRMDNLDAFLDAMEPWPPADPFWFGWLSSPTARRWGAASWRPVGSPPTRAVRRRHHSRARSLDLPALCLHPQIIRRYNARRFRRLPTNGVNLRQPIETFYFPLDHINGFNRNYGRRGFYSVHCGIPHGDREGLRKLLAEVVHAHAGSMASVLKPMGGPGEGFISFPFKGYAFAVDLPRRSGVEELHARLERITLDHGGRLYAAKDALMSAAGFA